MAFEWDETKSQANLAKHGIDFHTASLAFDDPFALTMRDESHSDEESRFIYAGRHRYRSHSLCGVYGTRSRHHSLDLGSRGNPTGKGNL
jgi:uncharacterized DUF497 family protein